MKKILCLVLALAMLSGCAILGGKSLSNAGHTKIDAVRYGQDGKPLAEAHYSSGKDIESVEASIKKVGDDYEATIKAKGVLATDAIKQTAGVAKTWAETTTDVVKELAPLAKMGFAP